MTSINCTGRWKEAILIFVLCFKTYDYPLEQCVDSGLVVEYIEQK